MPEQLEAVGKACTNKVSSTVCAGKDSEDSERLEKFFPGVVKPGELTRPEKVEILISTRQGRLAPQRMMMSGDLVLWDGPLGKTVSGVHPDCTPLIDPLCMFHESGFQDSRGSP